MLDALVKQFLYYSDIVAALEHYGSSAFKYIST